MVTVVGQGLAGTLVGLALEKRGQSFVVVDQGSGSTSSRAAAGIFNPLTGPRFSAGTEKWDQIIPYYRNIEDQLGAEILHPIDLIRPLEGAKVGPESFPRSAPGWSAELCPQADNVRIRGGGWVNIENLLNSARGRWKKAGILEERYFDPRECEDNTVLWCGGISDFASPQWSSVPDVSGCWQAVRGDVLTVKIPDLGLAEGEIGSRFLIPLGNDVYRWGATHEIDVLDMSFRPEARQQLEADLKQRLKGIKFETLKHAWGVRPASRTKSPLIVEHPDHHGWTLFNGFGGRGVVLIPQALSKVVG